MTLDFPVFPLAGWDTFNQVSRPRGGICPSFHYWDSFNDKRGNYIHGGIDMYANLGTYIVSVSNGKVKKYRGTDYPYDADGGNNIYIVSDNAIYYYSHMLNPSIYNIGDEIKAGQLIGQVGQTGNAKKSCPHLHFQCYARGKNDVKGRLLNPFSRLKELEHTSLPDFKPENGIIINDRKRSDIVPFVLVGLVLLSIS